MNDKQVNPTNQLKEIFHNLERFELSVAVLYETFAALLPESKNAWLVFAGEERLHAGWVKRLYGDVKEGKIPLGPAHFTVQSIQLAIDYTESQTAKVAQEKPDLQKFLNIAINTERSLLERAYLKMFNLTAPEAQKIRTQLEEATKSHLEGLIAWRARVLKAS